VAFLAVWLEHGLKRNAIDGAVDRRNGIFDPARARLFLLAGGDPVDPIPARIGRTSGSSSLAAGAISSVGVFE